jgi:hypothetical protein
VPATLRKKLIPVLQPLDNQLVGTFIQLFNDMDFNLRQAIETFAHTKLRNHEPCPIKSRPDSGGSSPVIMQCYGSVSRQTSSFAYLSGIPPQLARAVFYGLNETHVP